MLTLVVALLCSGTAEEQSTGRVVVALGRQTDLTRRLDIIRRVRPFGETLSTREVFARLAGISPSELLSAEQMQAMAERADNLDAEGNADEAGSLRAQVIDAYEHTPTLDAKIQLQAALALHSLAGALVVANRKKDALALFATAHQRFPTVPIDVMRHRPDVVRVYERATADARRAPTTKVTVQTTRAGTLGFDSNALGPIQTTRVFDAPLGRLMVWVSDARGRSLAHLIEVGTEPMTVTVDFDLESRLVNDSGLHLSCSTDCDSLLLRMRRAGSFSQVIGVRMTGTDTSETVIADESEMTRRSPLTEVDDIADPPFIAPPDHRISPWSFAPFGVGQLKQKRHVLGGALLGLAAGALTWNIVSAVNRDRGTEDDSPAQQNISAALLVAIGLVSTAESLIYDYRHSDYPAK